MKINKKARIQLAGFLSFGVMGSLEVRAEETLGYDAKKDESYCSTYNLTQTLVDGIQRTEDPSFDILNRINVSTKTEVDIEYFITFRLIQSLVEIEDGFAQTEDYERLKRAFVHQLLRYSSHSGDKTRPSLYLACLDTIIEPELDLPISVNYPNIEWQEPSENSKLHIKCMVESDVPFLPFKEVAESAEVARCLSE